MDQYQINEELGREAFMDVMRANHPSLVDCTVGCITFAEDPHSVWDAKMELVAPDNSITTVVIEIKVRDRAYNTMILEKKKLMSLQETAKNIIGKTLISYVNICPTHTYSWSVTNLDKKMASSSGYFNKNSVQGNAKKQKEVYYIPLEKATKYAYKFDREELSKRFM